MRKCRHERSPQIPQTGSGCTSVHPKAPQKKRTSLWAHDQVQQLVLLLLPELARQDVDMAEMKQAAVSICSAEKGSLSARRRDGTIVGHHVACHWQHICKGVLSVLRLELGRCLSRCIHVHLTIPTNCALSGWCAGRSVSNKF